MQHRWLILKLDNVGQALNNSQSGCIRCTIRGAQRRELYIMQGDIYISGHQIILALGCQSAVAGLCVSA